MWRRAAETLPRLRWTVGASSAAPDTAGEIGDRVSPVSLQVLPRRGGRVVMQRPAKPCTPVRFRPPPPTSRERSVQPDRLVPFHVVGLVRLVVVDGGLQVEQVVALLADAVSAEVELCAADRLEGLVALEAA